MAPILKLDYSKILSEGSAVRAVDDHGSKHTLPSLDGIMRVIPGCSVVLGDPSVSHGRTWCDWALGNGWHTIVHVVVQLTNTVEMDRCAVSCEKIVDLDNNCITPASSNGRAWRLAVDLHDETLYTIGGSGAVGDIELVEHDVASDWSVLV